MNQNVPDVVVQAALAYTGTTNLTDALLALMGTEVKQCANELCKKAFLFQEGPITRHHRSDAQYCKPVCARRATQRRYVQRKRQAKRDQEGGG